ncbi:MAG: tetratricopeptide repeat protein [Nitrospiria bacterium]
MALVGLSILFSVGCASTSLHQRGLEADKKGDFDEAVGHYVEHLKAHPGDLRVRNDLGVAYLRGGKYNRAFLEFKKVLIRDPKYVIAYYNIGLIYNFKGLIDEEIKAYEQALLIDPDHRPTRLNLAHVYLGQGKIEQATQIYKDVLQKYPDQSRALYNLALIYDQAGKTTEAITLLEHLLSLNKAGIDPTLPRDQAEALLSRLKAVR